MPAECLARDFSTFLPLLSVILTSSGRESGGDRRSREFNLKFCVPPVGFGRVMATRIIDIKFFRAGIQRSSNLVISLDLGGELFDSRIPMKF